MSLRLTERLSRDLPEGRRGQVLAIGLLLSGLALVWLLCLGPLIGLYAGRAAHIAQKRETLARMTRLQETLPHLRQTAARRATGESRLITGGSDAIAGANLQDRLQHLSTAFSVELSSSETLPPLSEGRYRRIGLHVTLTGPYAALIQVLTAFETEAPAMAVDALHLHAAESEDGTTDRMACEMNVYAYRSDTLLRSGKANAL
ncbi:general secretion pathway protein GspM [Asaia sp. W19]|uniref:type II secretion system protein GspM n=1 Tax=unclassified Asaia TaxID=2685023 RepID=UPI000F8ED6DA|nr:type II secretion system protein GspM [Asaia sp. W19]RUT26392.1 general secretion pathway protein GspM [Asaia sp. W19]